PYLFNLLLILKRLIDYLDSAFNLCQFIHIIRFLGFCHSLYYTERLFIYVGFRVSFILFGC
ncbi:hypothetical protein Leryth_026907, partial [Lithospermum erythrorhizon]